MKRLTPEELLKIDSLQEERKVLEPVRDRYYEAGRELTKLIERQKYWEKEDKYRKITNKCEYRAPEFPRMGEPGQDGFAYFSCHENAVKLIEALNEGSWGRQRYFELVWTDFGKYRCEPSYEHDYRDSSLCYTGTFKKIEE